MILASSFRAKRNGALLDSTPRGRSVFARPIVDEVVQPRFVSADPEFRPYQPPPPPEPQASVGPLLFWGLFTVVSGAALFWSFRSK